MAATLEWVVAMATALSLAGCDRCPQGQQAYDSGKLTQWGAELCVTHGGLSYWGGGGKTRHKAVCNDGSVIRVDSSDYHSLDTYYCK